MTHKNKLGLSFFFIQFNQNPFARRSCFNFCVANYFSFISSSLAVGFFFEYWLLFFFSLSLIKDVILINYSLNVLVIIFIFYGVSSDKFYFPFYSFFEFMFKI